ncbi:FxDxF family PEP-CTERM protein [Piscinibacter sp.]|uniref:FxDxF family PEP-CTERM protein n=1 Tax=Piscinibacter sp. TaxID=1903157 RepID=UPI002C86FB8F|nr:FxDxF family PEP-CTERM protein [Albitalea sp.]HUG25010.1 FxDxF family PEP-CTERM protein [Albitalea sp.]
MKLKALAAAAALFATTAAHALTGPGSLGNIDNQTIAIGNTHGAGVSFSDVYAFSVSNIGLGAGVVFDFALDPLPNLPGPEFDIEFSSITFLDAALTVLAHDADGSDGWSLLTLLPTSGSYSFVVEGTAVGNFGGTYAGVLTTFVPSPIPEPGTYALLLAGLGVVGFVAKRRKSQ